MYVFKSKTWILKKPHKLFFIYKGGVNLSVIKISYISPYHHFLIWQITRWNLLKEVSVLNRPSDHVFWFLLLIQIMMRVNVFHTCFRASEQRNVWLIKNLFDKCLMLNLSSLEFYTCSASDFLFTRFCNALSLSLSVLRHSDGFFSLPFLPNHHFFFTFSR